MKRKMIGWQGLDREAASAWSQGAVALLGQLGFVWFRCAAGAPGRLVVAALIGLAAGGGPRPALAQSGQTGEPTPPPDPLTVEIVGPMSGTVNCDPLIYHAEIDGGTQPYTVIWNPSGNGDQMWCIFREAGKQTVYCRVMDGGSPRLSTTATLGVDVAERDEVGDGESVEEYGESMRGSDTVVGDPTGQPIQVCVAKSVDETTAVTLSIPFSISIVEAKLGYSHNENIKMEASYCFSPVIPSTHQASIEYRKVFLITTGELVRRNCLGVYETGTYSGRKLDHLCYELKIEPVHE